MNPITLEELVASIDGVEITETVQAAGTEVVTATKGAGSVTVIRSASGVTVIATDPYGTYARMSLDTYDQEIARTLIAQLLSAATPSGPKAEDN